MVVTIVVVCIRLYTFVISLQIIYDICWRKNNERILVDPTSNVRSSQRLSHACLSTY